MANHDIVAIGTSAGGVEALIFLAKHFPRNFPTTVLVTIHLPGHVTSRLDELLSRAGPLPAAFAKDGDVLKKSHIYIAPPDRHLLVVGDQLALGIDAASGPRGAMVEGRVQIVRKEQRYECAPLIQPLWPLRPWGANWEVDASRRNARSP